ncbi:MAG: DUF2735 domain-containing protein [Hyphomicrobium sp.]|nr:DUF2735 domain-containing protein [Hyphomicrobium sp.]
MTDVQHHQTTATIIPFPDRHQRAAAQRIAELEATAAAMKTAPCVASTGWYHDDAITEVADTPAFRR